MPRPARRLKICGRYYTWLLYARQGVWQADGRSNRPTLGRQSLGTNDLQEAHRLLAELDLTMAVKHGLADRSALSPVQANELSLSQGRQLYMEHVARPRVAGGVRETTAKRYKAVFDKFLAFTASQNLTTWNRVTAATLTNYAKHLEAKGYAFRTLYLELTALKQVQHWLVAEGHLPASSRIRLPLEKPSGSDTYCWTLEQVNAMVQHCGEQPDLGWLGDVLLALAMTGLRISELVNLRWTDLDLDKGVPHLVDESALSQSRKARNGVRTLKSGRNRSLPIHQELRNRLQTLPRHPDGFVFHGPRGGRIKPDSLRNILVRDVLKPLAGRFPSSPGQVGFLDGRLHSFRHFFCSLCANRRVAQRIVMSWLGHSDSRMVAHYYHLHDDEARRQMDLLSLDETQSGGASPPDA